MTKRELVELIVENGGQCPHVTLTFTGCDCDNEDEDELCPGFAPSGGGIRCRCGFGNGVCHITTCVLLKE